MKGSIVFQEWETGSSVRMPLLPPRTPVCVGGVFVRLALSPLVTSVPFIQELRRRHTQRTTNVLNCGQRYVLWRVFEPR